MKRKTFDEVSAEAVSFGVRYYERPDHKGRVHGYSVVRQDDQTTASMLYMDGKWRVTFRDFCMICATKAKAADIALDLVANADPT